MGFVLKQNKAISIDVMKALISSFRSDIVNGEPGSWEQQRLCMGLVYSIISFGASLRGSEGLKLDMESLIKNLKKGKDHTKGSGQFYKGKGHVIIPIKGRVKGEKGERCYLLLLANITVSGIEIR
jgi:hypothetical protein